MSQISTTRREEKKMQAMQALSEEDPIMKAWRKYRATEEAQNSEYWAKHVTVDNPRDGQSTINHLHLEGALWAAFLAGYMAALHQFNQRREEMENQTILNIAQVCHEANRAWCEANGDHSQPVWDEAPDWQKDSAIDGVKFHLANPHADDSASHDNWLAEKERTGWVYGESKDPDAKTHPCMVPFHELPMVQRVKDALFRACVHACAK